MACNEKRGFGSRGRAVPADGAANRFALACRVRSRQKGSLPKRPSWEGMMRLSPWLALTLTLAACSSAPPNSAKITLRNMQWNHVNVQAVITRAGNCDDRGSDFVSSQDFVLQKE